MNAGILSLWAAWDMIYQRCTRLQYISKGQNIFRIVVLRYRGEPLLTHDNCRIQSGDLIIKLHIHNYYLATLCKGIKNDTRMILLLRKLIMDSLPQLASFVAAHPRLAELKGIVGTTMLTKGGEHLGFTITDTPDTWFFRYKRWYLKLMLRVIHPEGSKRLQRSQHMQLKRVFMSKEELFRRYLPTKE